MKSVMLRESCRKLCATRILASVLKCSLQQILTRRVVQEFWLQLRFTHYLTKYGNSILLPGSPQDFAVLTPMLGPQFQALQRRRSLEPQKARGTMAWAR